MTGDSATLSALIVVVGLAATALMAGGLLASRTRRVVAISRRSQQRGREHELSWAAIRLRSNGHRGAELQELLCTLTNCTPAEADHAIERVGADI